MGKNFDRVEFFYPRWMSPPNCPLIVVGSLVVTTKANTRGDIRVATQLRCCQAHGVEVTFYATKDVGIYSVSPHRFGFCLTVEAASPDKDEQQRMHESHAIQDSPIEAAGLIGYLQKLGKKFEITDCQVEIHNGPAVIDPMIAHYICAFFGKPKKSGDVGYVNDLAARTTLLFADEETYI